MWHTASPFGRSRRKTAGCRLSPWRRSLRPLCQRLPALWKGGRNFHVPGAPRPGMERAVRLLLRFFRASSCRLIRAFSVLSGFQAAHEAELDLFREDPDPRSCVRSARSSQCKLRGASHAERAAPTRASGLSWILSCELAGRRSHAKSLLTEQQEELQRRLGDQQIKATCRGSQNAGRCRMNAKRLIESFKMCNYSCRSVTPSS